MEILDPLSKTDLHLAANLISEADRQYFDIFSESENEITNKITEMYSDERTDFSQVKVIYVEKKMVGAIVFYPASERYIRQSFSLSYLKSGPNFDEKALKRFNETVSDFESHGLYLSRIAISSKYQGKGFCKKALDLLSSIALSNGYNEIRLHVRSDNYAAIKCYTDVGYKYADYEIIKLYRNLKKHLVQNDN